MATISSNDDWTVQVEVLLPHCPSAQAAYEKLASPSKWKEWRSSDFVKMKVTLADGVTEPIHTGDEWYFHPLFFLAFTNRALESQVTGDRMVFDAQGKGLCGLVDARLRFEVYKNEKGEWMGKAQEKHTHGMFLPKLDVVEGEHRTMFQELDQLFAENK